MKLTIRDAFMPTDAVVVDDEGIPEHLNITAVTGLAQRQAVIALDFRGAALLAQVLIPFLKTHPELRALAAAEGQPS